MLACVEVVKGHSGASWDTRSKQLRGGGRRYASGDHPECLGGSSKPRRMRFRHRGWTTARQRLSRGSRAIESSHEIRFTSSTSCSMLLLQSLPWRTVTRRQCGHLDHLEQTPLDGPRALLFAAAVASRAASTAYRGSMVACPCSMPSSCRWSPQLRSPCQEIPLLMRALPCIARYARMDGFRQW